VTLTNLKCKNAEAREKSYKLAAGGGLYLEVMPNGSKYWRQKYQINGREKRLAIGVFPEISLAKAREAQSRAKVLIKNGQDPSAIKQQTKRQAQTNAENNFRLVAMEWFEMKKDDWSVNHAKNVLHRLETDIFPDIGNRPIADIDPPELLAALKRIEKRGALEIAARAKQVCGQVFRYGIQTGRCSRDPSVDLRGALKTNKTQHFPAIDMREIPAFLEALNRNDARLYARTRGAIKLSMLFFVRPNELRQAQWSEIDLGAREWTIPACKMKMGKDHIVPLSRQAIEILEEQREEVGHLSTDWVFPSQFKPRNPMSNGTVNVAIKKLGYHGRMTAHGFRALARTTIREKLRYDSEVIERQLAHAPSGSLGAAYDRTQFIEERHEMMQDWANYVDAVSSEKNVIIGGFGVKRNAN